MFSVKYELKPKKQMATDQLNAFSEGVRRSQQNFTRVHGTVKLRTPDLNMTIQHDQFQICPQMRNHMYRDNAP